MKHMTTTAMLMAVLSSGACIVESDADDDDASSTAGSGGDGSVGSGGSDAVTTGQGGTQASGWTHVTHPCVGNRTDALLVEDAATWVGCGSTTVGFGLHVSEDGGQSWSQPAISPAGALDEFRVLDVSRGSDGRLYVAGTAPGGKMVVSLDTDASPMVLTEVLTAGPTVDESFVVGTFRLRADGSALAESLNGNGMLYRPTATTGPNGFQDGWENAYYWASGGEQTFQLLDMETHGDGFYGCGSTIADTPKVYLPDPGAQAPYHMKVIELDTYDGEMWSLDVAPNGGIIVGGVDQDRNVGMVYVGDAAGTSFETFDLSTVLPESSTWIRGVCSDGQRAVAVGEFSQTSDPLLFTSVDGGITWEEMTPDAATAALSECVVLADGSFVVVGGDGYLGHYRP